MKPVSICIRLLTAALAAAAVSHMPLTAETGSVELMSLAAQTPQERYVELWGPTAVREMYRSGVPASITLAQGILESRSGQSPLAAEGNNHFGIKCHTDWKGKTMKVDDDAKGECFRVYDNASQSFRDHSDFLRYRDRYKFLFDFDTKDYESWAYGLKKAGYATDPTYASKLIKIIEDYDLSRFDSMTVAQADKLEVRSAREVKEAEKSAEKVSENTTVTPDTKTAKTKKQKKADKKADKKQSSETAKAKEPSQDAPKELDRKARRKLRLQQAEQEAAALDVIPQAPNAIERAKSVSREAAEEFRFSLSRPVYTLNGVAFVYAIEGETYTSIASSFHLFPKEILSMNDLAAEARLTAGTVVFVQQKKNQAEAGLDKYIVEEDGESLRDVCQRFAVKQKAVEKMNDFKPGHQLRAGDTVILRK